LAEDALAFTAATLLLSLREKAKAVEAPRIGRGPGTLDLDWFTLKEIVPKPFPVPVPSARATKFVAEKDMVPVWPESPKSIFIGPPETVVLLKSFTGKLGKLDADASVVSGTLM
jgi:hypothetical protein